MKKTKEMIRISYREIENGFNLIEFIKEINNSPKVINLIADNFPTKYENNKFIIDRVFLTNNEIESLKEIFPNTIINVDSNLCIIAYLIEIL